MLCVVRDERQTSGERVGRDERVLNADRSALCFEPSGYLAKLSRRFGTQRDDFDSRDEGIDQSVEPPRTSSLGPKAQFSKRNRTQPKL